MKTEQIHLFVSGTVQGVGFRYAAQAQARKLGVKGWVRNTPDGRVEIWAEGSTDQLDHLVDWCGIGPAQADVEKVEVRARVDVPQVSFSDFEIRR